MNQVAMSSIDKEGRGRLILMTSYTMYYNYFLKVKNNIAPLVLTMLLHIVIVIVSCFCFLLSLFHGLMNARQCV